MKSRTRTAAAIAAAALAIFEALWQPSLLLGEEPPPTTTAGEIPSVLYADVPARLDPTYPMWLGAAEVIDASGQVTDQLPAHLRSTIESLIASPVPGRCIEVTEYYDNYPALQGGTLAEAIDNSEQVLTGVVTARAFGFELDEPGQLLRLDLEEVQKGSTAVDYFYFFVPVGRFWAGPYEICKTDARFPVVPAVGDRIMLLVPGVRNPGEHYLRTSRDASLIILREADVVLPKQFETDDTFASPSDFLGWVEQRVGGTQQ